MNRFKGKAEIMDRNGPTGLVGNSTNPIRTKPHTEQTPTTTQPSYHTRMDLNAVQRNYLNFPNQFEPQIDPRAQLTSNQHCMPMAPMFMQPMYDINQINYMQYGFYPPHMQGNTGYANQPSPPLYPQVNL